MAIIGKSLDFEATEIDELLEMKYGGQRTFPVLAALYPGLDLTKPFHEDHVFPRSRFTTRHLMAAGVAPADIDHLKSLVDLLPNLQLLGGIPNIEKSAQLPADWLNSAFADTASRRQYEIDNDLTSVPPTLSAFADFFESRKAALRMRLIQHLGVRVDPSDPDGATPP